MAKSVNPEKLVGLPALAKEFGYHPKYLSRLARERRFRVWRIGNTWATTREIFAKYIKVGRASTNPGRKRGGASK
jgi:hypothetical protein